MSVTRKDIKEELEKQIIADAEDGDTTTLAEILGLLTDDQLYHSLSDKNKEKLGYGWNCCILVETNTQS